MFERYAIFYTPTGTLADWGAAWLGWDSARGCEVAHPDIAGHDVELITATPRKYGLHATLKAPFHLHQTASLADLQAATANFAAKQNAFGIGALDLRQDAGFVALRPMQEIRKLRDFASATVKALDPFRAALTQADISRRRETPLTARQDNQMLKWGYPFIFDDYHFHMTLSSRVSTQQGGAIIETISPALMQIVPNPFVIDAITLMGQDGKGMFHQIERYSLPAG